MKVTKKNCYSYTYSICEYNDYNVSRHQSIYLSFIKIIIEKAIATQIHSHLINNDIVDNFQLHHRVIYIKISTSQELYIEITSSQELYYILKMMVHRQYRVSATSRTGTHYAQTSP